MIRLGKQKEMEEDDEEREREKSLKREELWNGERRERREKGNTCS